MSLINSDLEEGEILDSPPSPSVIDKGKVLPRRYVVCENKNSAHKHKKKDCKHSIRYHAKKLSKMKKTPPTKRKNYHKKFHRSMCSRERGHKKEYAGSSSSGLSINNYHFSQNSLISEMKGSFKDANKQSTKSNKYKSENFQTKTQKNKTSRTDFDTSKAEGIKASKNNSQVTEIQPKDNCTLNSVQYDQHSVKNVNVVQDILKIISDNTLKTLDNVSSNNPSEANNEDSEDEEELRRLALATCAKRNDVTEASKSVTQNVDNNHNIPVPELPAINNVQISNHEASNVASDNYEVVDMEVDDDDQSSSDIIQTSIKIQNSEYLENLFVIDTNPSVDFVGNKENSFSELQATNNSTDEEFEADILRAELIDSMYRKKYKTEQEQESDAVLHKTVKQMPVLPPKHVVNYQKRNVNFHRKSLSSSKHVLRKHTINKPKNLNSNINKKASPVEPSKPPERLIIALNDESSSEDSDEANTVSENPVKSIEALISDCRQKSNEKIKETTAHVETSAHVLKAVSCLSKSQQEEYNSLKKILAEKEKSQVVLPQKNGSNDFLSVEIKQLQGKLMGMKDSLKNKKGLETSLSKDVNLKKAHYLKAKLSAQHLKEQYIAAEKVRKAKLFEWSKACHHLQNVKQSICELEKNIDSVQSSFPKIGSSIQGQSYNLPLLPSGNKQS